MRKLRLLQSIALCFLFATALLAPGVLHAQELETPTGASPADEEQAAPDQVSVEPAAQDDAIAARLERILEATGWFTASVVEVREGVVFLDGWAGTVEQKEWAGNLARNTQDVVAVVNRIEVLPRPLWDFSPAVTELRALWREVILAIPLIAFGVVVLLFSWWIASVVAHFAFRVFDARLASSMLARIAARSLAAAVFLLGLYLVLQVTGLTRLALTVLGGTGIVGIVIGFAFRDIAENFLASVLLSVRQPFQRDDLIEVAGEIGIVQKMNTRSTVLLTLDGNHVQIPNAAIFKGTIINYTANPNRRSDFLIGVGYENAIAQVQKIIAEILVEHPSVLDAPEPLVLVDQLASATVNLRVYFWYDATQYAPIKIKSSLLRMIKRALQDANISMPDEAREVIFPNGVPVLSTPVSQPSLPASTHKPPSDSPARRKAIASQPVASEPVASEPVASEPVASEAEGDLSSDQDDVLAQAHLSRIPEEGADLLQGRSRTAASA